MVRRASAMLAVFVTCALLLAGCGGSSDTQELTVFAATSLTGAFSELGEQFEAERADVDVTFNFGASSALVQQLQEGASADVLAAADSATMAKAADLVGTSAVFARNRLVIVTKPGNPQNIRGLGDLPSAGVVALCGADVPCGKYAAEALAKAGVALSESKVTRGQNVAATLAAVAEGDAVAGIVYATDASPRVAVVTIPGVHNIVAAYPIAVVRAAGSDAARAFVSFVRSAAGQRILRDYGFLPA